MGRLFSALVLLAVISQAVSSVEPEDRAPAIISRGQWGARPPKSTPQGLRENPPRYVVIHHSTGPTCTTRANCQARIRNIQSYHIDNRGWNDLGYNFLVGEDGNAYEGRGWGIRGAHSPSYNSKSIGICFIGNYMTRRPSSAAIRAAKRIIATGVANGKLKSSYKVLGHRQTYATACPGNSLYNEIQTWPHCMPPDSITFVPCEYYGANAGGTTLVSCADLVGIHWWHHYVTMFKSIEKPPTASDIIRAHPIGSE